MEQDGDREERGVEEEDGRKVRLGCVALRRRTSELSELEGEKLRNVGAWVEAVKDAVPLYRSPASSEGY